MLEGSYIVKNFSIVANGDARFEHTKVYEVIRFVNGLPLFFDAHLARFKQSCKLAALDCSVSSSLLADLLVQLAIKCNVQNCNLKYFLSVEDNEATFYAGFIKSSYPSPTMYNEGVRVGVIFQERSNPNAKIDNSLLRDSANRLIAEQDLYEVALVNHLGCITEGSRSNLFFVYSDGKLLTSPISEVLGGITREVVLEEVAALGYTLEHRNVALSEIPAMKAAFITGTSPEVLPIAWFNGVSLDASNQLVRKIGKCYKKRVEEELHSFQNRYLYNRK
jgi:branched-chain amino acid aminotransferase